MSVAVPFLTLHAFKVWTWTALPPQLYDVGRYGSNIHV
jgi:hypothetical protein